MPRDAELACVTLEYPDRGFVVDVAEVVTFHGEAPAGELRLLELDPLLGALAVAPASPAYILVVRRDGGGQLGFRTRAEVRLARARARSVFRLPGVLREAGCSSWVNGVIVGDESGTIESGTIESLRIWISLLHLARSVERGA